MHASSLAALALSGLLLLSGACRRGAPHAPAPAADGPRIVSLAPSLTEILFAIGAGDLVVGRTSACNYPPEAAAVPIVGGFGEPSLEMLVSVRPTLILDVELADPTTAARLRDLGLRREQIPCRLLDDIPPAIEAVGRLAGREASASAMAADLAAGLARLRNEQTADATRPRVYVEIWSDPLTTAGRTSFLSELIALAGGANIGDEAAQPYFQVSPEWVVSRDPEVILCLYMSPRGQARELVAQRPAWGPIAAIRTGRICDSFDNDLILRPGPRVLDSIGRLRACIRPAREEAP